MVANGNDNVNNVFSSFYNNFNKIINKHAPIKKLSNRKAKQLSKPWITSGIRASISIKNKLYASGDDRKYRFYRNKICNLIRLSKKRYYQNYFEHNITNIKKTWEGINELLNRQKKETRIISALKDNNHKMVTEASQIPNILNKHFATVGNRLASKLPSSQKHYLDYVGECKSPTLSFFSQPVLPEEINSEILPISNSKSYDLIVLFAH
jgi:hypothetical protein